MADYTERPRPRYRQRYWYLANDEVLREPTLLTTPAERRWAIEDDSDSFWSSELTGQLDAWAERTANDRGTAVMCAVPNRKGDEGAEFVRETFLDALDETIGTVEATDQFEFGAAVQSKFTFVNGADAVVFKIALTKNYSYRSNYNYTLSWECVKTEPQHTREIEQHENGPNCFSPIPKTRTLEGWEITNLLGEEWGEDSRAVAVEVNDYVEVAAEFCRLSMQIADFTTIGDGLDIYEAKWNPAYVSSLQDALKNEGPIKRLQQALGDMQSALQDMGFEVSSTKDSEIYNLAANGGATPLIVSVHDKKERPHTAMVVDFPSGRIFSSNQNIQPDTLTLYEMAMKRAEKDGTAEDLRAALAVMTGRKALEDHQAAQRAVKTALDILPRITPN